MQVDYDAFRSMPWDERVNVFSAMPAEERAELVRTNIGRWLEAHRSELSPAQIAIVEENVAFVTAELYATPGVELRRRAGELEARTAELLTRAQMREALPMHW